MSSPQPLLILTDDDLLAERWQGLGQSPVRARNLEAVSYTHLTLPTSDLV